MNHEYGRMFMDMVKRMEASLSQMGRTAKLQAPTQTRSGRIPKEWVKFTGDPATIVKEYQDYERQAYRANFRTWREFFDQFEECIQKDSRFDKVYIPFREEDDFQRVKKVAIARADDQLWLTLYTDPAVSVPSCADRSGCTPTGGRSRMG